MEGAFPTPWGNLSTWVSTETALSPKQLLKGVLLRPLAQVAVNVLSIWGSVSRDSR